MPDVGLITHSHISYNQSNWDITNIIPRKKKLKKEKRKEGERL